MMPLRRDVPWEQIDIAVHTYTIIGWGMTKIKVQYDKPIKT